MKKHSDNSERCVFCGLTFNKDSCHTEVSSQKHLLLSGEEKQNVGSVK